MEDFREYLRDFRQIAAWALGSASIPFVGYLSGLAPLEPEGIVSATAVFQILALTTVYHFQKRKARAAVDRAIRRSMVAICVVFFVYLALYVFFSYEVVQFGVENNVRRYAGFVCKPEIAAAPFGQACPFVGEELLPDSQWEASAIWTSWSIRAVEFVVAVLWIALFFLLARFLGSFVLYLRR